MKNYKPMSPEYFTFVFLLFDPKSIGIESSMDAVDAISTASGEQPSPPSIVFGALTLATINFNF